jgi:glucose/arabinose dehydrogenase
MFPSKMQNNLFIALHGSWNRSSKVGYKLLRVAFDQSGNVVDVVDFISGWLQEQKVLGRPSAPLILSDGSMLLSDDQANVIYRITYSP